MSDAFARALARVVAAQVCESFGFQAIQRSAIDTLADVLIRYLSEIGGTAHAYTEHAGRVESHLADVLLALSDVGAPPSDIIRFANCTPDTQFAQPVPKFPIRKKSRSLTPSFAQRGEEPPHGDIPDWLPALPDRHTYVATPVWRERPSNPRKDSIELGKERRRAEKSLVSLSRRLQLRFGRAAPPLDATAGRGGVALQQRWNLDEQRDMQLVDEEATAREAAGGNAAIEANPFLAPPRLALEVAAPQPMGPLAGETQVPSVLEAFAPALEAAKARAAEAEPQEDDGMDVDRGDGSQPNTQLVTEAKPAGFLHRPQVLMPLSFDWVSKTRAKGRLANRALLVAGGGLARQRREADNIKDEDKLERRRRAEQILAQAEKQQHAEGHSPEKAP
eukprot:SM000061S19284  [mRNA]  locus=s61:524736:526653:- [translate_table: standard]